LSDNTKINFTLRKKDISSSRRKEQIKGIDFGVESRKRKKRKINYNDKKMIHTERVKEILNKQRSHNVEFRFDKSPVKSLHQKDSFQRQSIEKVINFTIDKVRKLTNFLKPNLPSVYYFIY
jgi:hypothetical protein